GPATDKAGYGAMRTINGLDELRKAEGEVIGTSEWHQVTQDDVNTFADGAGAPQWIHVDVERARQTPFGGTIAHGYYTLSLAPRLSDQILRLDGFAFGPNYGLNRVRFPGALPVGQRVRMTCKIAKLDDIPGGAQITFENTFEVEGGEHPA